MSAKPHSKTVDKTEREEKTERERIYKSYKR